MENPSKDQLQKEKWKKEGQEKLEAASSQIQNIVDNFQTNPEEIAELFAFGSRFHQYSSRNTMLIYDQNPNVTFVQSFFNWKKDGYNVKKGEHGLKVFVPTKITILQLPDHKTVLLSHATKQQQQDYKAGKTPSRTQLKFTIGNVFDISQTTCPVEAYPKYYNMGYQNENCQLLFSALKDYAAAELNTKVDVTDLHSISLRGDFTVFPDTNGHHELRINSLLKDTEALSTLTHELGHSAIHKNETDKPTVVAELEADCYSIMLQTHVGIELTESRKRHLARHYKELEKHNKKLLDSGNKDDIVKFEDLISNVFSIYEGELPKIDQAIDQTLGKESIHSKPLSYQNATDRFCRQQASSVHTHSSALEL